MPKNGADIETTDRLIDEANHEIRKWTKIKDQLQKWRQYMETTN